MYGGMSRGVGRMAYPDAKIDEQQLLNDGPVDRLPSLHNANGTEHTHVGDTG